MIVAMDLTVRRSPESRSKVAVKEVNVAKAGPLEETWIKRHQKRTGCTGKEFEKIGGILSEYRCKKCGKDIATTDGKS
jgi:hypothetical protein